MRFLQNILVVGHTYKAASHLGAQRRIHSNVSAERYLTDLGLSKLRTRVDHFRTQESQHDEKLTSSVLTWGTPFREDETSSVIAFTAYQKNKVRHHNTDKPTILFHATNRFGVILKVLQAAGFSCPRNTSLQYIWKILYHRALIQTFSSNFAVRFSTAFCRFCSISMGKQPL